MVNKAQEGMSRESVASLLIEASGTTRHSSDCATSQAPAEEPGVCDCNPADGYKQRAEAAEKTLQLIAHSPVANYQDAGMDCGNAGDVYNDGYQAGLRNAATEATRTLEGVP